MGKTSRFRGVSWYPRTQKWRASLGCGGKSITLGYFDDELEAARAYNNALSRYKGSSGHLSSLNDVSDGVMFLGGLGKWKACIHWRGQFIALGLFDSKAEAQSVYEAVKKTGFAPGLEDAHV